MACLQTKGGSAAKSLTAQEFAARAVDLHKAASAEYRKDPAAWGFKLRFSWDSASAHNSAERDMLDLLPEQIVKPPARSPDLQRPVENMHHAIHKEFTKRLSADHRIADVAAMIRLLHRVAKDVVTIEKVRKLIDGLPDTYRSVIERGGDWAGQGLR